MLAFWISASRVRENDHHPADVVTGGVIGSAWAVLWYVRYFTRLWDDHAAERESSESRRDEDFPMTA